MNQDDFRLRALSQFVMASPYVHFLPSIPQEETKQISVAHGISPFNVFIIIRIYVYTIGEEEDVQLPTAERMRVVHFIASCRLLQLFSI